MDGVAANSYKGLRSYFRRRDYHRLDGSSGRRRRSTRIEVPNRPKSRFFIRFKPKLKLKLRFRFLKRLGSPKKLLVRLRDAYVRMMLSFANSTVFTSGLGAVHGGDGGFGRASLKEYDERMILEIYASLMIQKKLSVDNNNCSAATNVAPLMRDRLPTVPEISTEQVS
ncbi:hypothetical protein Sjap_007356 [Stephania japonica]|uniref:Uncharacterized protein n=1 Tax=Stephania japonica TaxID=461633 RepID=A0AAP0PAC3_9MAGN